MSHSAAHWSPPSPTTSATLGSPSRFASRARYNLPPSSAHLPHALQQGSALPPVGHPYTPDVSTEQGRAELAARLVRDSHLFLVPSINPDGFNKRRRETAGMVDLNRNFPDQFRSKADNPNLEPTGGFMEASVLRPPRSLASPAYASPGAPRDESLPAGRAAPGSWIRLPAQCESATPPLCVCREGDGGGPEHDALHPEQAVHGLRGLSRGERDPGC